MEMDRITAVPAIRIDLHDLTKQMCERLGVDMSTVYRLDITPTDATVYRFATRDGRKYVVEDDEGNREPAFADPITFQIRG